MGRGLNSLSIEYTDTKRILSLPLHFKQQEVFDKFVQDYQNLCLKQRNGADRCLAILVNPISGKKR
jgi:hypothetical protein